MRFFAFVYKVFFTLYRHKAWLYWFLDLVLRVLENSHCKQHGGSAAHADLRYEKCPLRGNIGKAFFNHA